MLAISEAISWACFLPRSCCARRSASQSASRSPGRSTGSCSSYGATAVLLALHQRWTIWPTVAAIGSAIVPYATIPTEIWLARSGRLAGAWRLEESADAADRRWYDGPLRWFLRRPWVLGLLILLAVAALFTVLLLIGPPGGR